MAKSIILAEGMRGGRTDRQRTQVRQNTPDASGNVWNELEPMIGENSPRSNPYRRDSSRLHSGQKPVPIHSIHCNGQRGDYFIGNDPRRPKKNYEPNVGPYKL